MAVIKLNVVKKIINIYLNHAVEPARIIKFKATVMQRQKQN